MKTVKTSEIGTKHDETRATFIVAKDQLEKLKAVAYWNRCTIKDTLAEALTEYLIRRKDLKVAMSKYARRKTDD